MTRKDICIACFRSSLSNIDSIDGKDVIIDCDRFNGVICPFDGSIITNDGRLVNVEWQDYMPAHCQYEHELMAAE